MVMESDIRPELQKTKPKQSSMGARVEPVVSSQYASSWVTPGAPLSEWVFNETEAGLATSGGEALGTKLLPPSRGGPEMKDDAWLAADDAWAPPTSKGGSLIMSIAHHI